MQRIAESCLKMDEPNPLFSPLTVNGGPEVSFLRAEREVVRLPLRCNSFSCASLVAVVQVPQQTFQTLVLFFPQGILNHCFDDIETFMGKLQQTAEAVTVLNQRKKNKKKKSKKQSAEGKKRLFLQGDTCKSLFPI